MPAIYGGEDVHTILQALELLPEHVGPTDTYEVSQVDVDNLLSGHQDGHPHTITLSDGSTVNVNNIQGIAFDGDGQIDFSEGISIVAEIIKFEGAAPAQPPIPVPIPVPTPQTPAPQPPVPTPSATPAEQGPSQPAAQPFDQQQIDQTMPEPVEDSPVEPIQEVAEPPLNDDVDLLGESAGEDYVDAESQEDFYETEVDEPPEADMIDGTTDSATDDF